MRKPSRHIIFPFLAFSFLLLTISAEAQQLKLGNNPTVIDPSAVLQLESPNQGLLLTRVPDTAAINAFFPPDGMIIYFTDGATSPPYGPNAGVYERKNGKWQRLLFAGDGSYWSLTGNSGTVPGTNFLGTTDAQPLVFKANGNQVGYLGYSGGSGDSNVIFGSGSNITGGSTNSVVIGSRASSSASQAVSIGPSASINNSLFGSASSGIAIGSGATINTVLGSSSSSIAIGSGANVTSVFGLASNAIAIGTNASVNWLQGIAIGASASATGQQTTALGPNTAASGMNGTAVGYQAQASGTNSFALGPTTNASGTNATALGNQAKSTATNATAIGNNAYAWNPNTIILGDTLSTDNVQVGMGTNNPRYNLEVNGTGKFDNTLNLGKDLYTSGSSGTSGQVLTSNGAGVMPSWQTPTGGTVTSVGLSLPNIFNVTNSPVTSSGTLTATFLSQNQNLVFASPNGASGTPLFRALVPADIPVLNQNTTGQAGSVAQSLTFNNSGSGAASGVTYNGSSAQTISYNTVGAPSRTGAGASGTWNISISGNAATATNSTQWNGATNLITSPNPGDVLTYNGATWINSSSAGSYWSLNGNSNVTANSYIGTTSTAGYFPLIFKVLGLQVGYLGTPGTSSNVAFGFGSSANFKSVAIGGNAVAAQNESISLGYTTNSNAFQSIAIGEANTTGQGSVVIGQGASSNSQNSIAIGSGASTNGTQNSTTAIGSGASASGYQSTAIGNGAQASQQNSTAIGNGAAANYPNALILGNNNVLVGIRQPNPQYALDVNGVIRVQGTTYNSDIRYKKNLQELRHVLSAIDSLHGYTYFFRTKEFKDRNFPDTKQIGMIAQEVEKYFPELVSTDKEGYKSLNYAQFTAILLEAIKEQQAEINVLKKENEQDKKTITDQLNALQQKVNALEKRAEKK